MGTITLSAELERALGAAAAEIGRSPDVIVADALTGYLADIQDYHAAKAAMRDHDPSQTVSLEQMRRELGIDD